jgi:hypothetical protein
MIDESDAKASGISTSSVSPNEIDEAPTRDVKITENEEFELTDSEKRQLYILQRAHISAIKAVQDEKDAQLAEFSFEPDVSEEEVVELYSDRRFFTALIFQVSKPFLILVCVFIMYLMVLYGVTTGIAPIQSESYAQGLISTLTNTSVILGIITVFMCVRSFFDWKGSYIYVTNTDILPYRPRILWLGLIGNSTVYPTQGMVIKRCTASWLNFIPGWNSWTVELDTPSQEDTDINILKSIKNGDRLASAINPSFQFIVKKRKFFFV